MLAPAQCHGCVIRIDGTGLRPLLIDFVPTVSRALRQLVSEDADQERLRFRIAPLEVHDIDEV